MIGVAEDHPRAGRFELIRRQAFDRSLCADGHEDRRFHDAVRRMQPTATGRAVGGQNVKADGHARGDNNLESCSEPDA